MFSKIDNITLLKNEPLKYHCSFKIGGKCKYFIVAHTIDALLDILHTCNQHSVKYKIIGNGSNLLFDDLGYNGAIVQYSNTCLNFKDNILYAGGGCSLSEIIQYSKQNNFGGFEFSIGVPAQLGGAIVNNLGAYNQEISTNIDHITVLKQNQIFYLTKKQADFKYHSSTFQNKDYIVLGATFIPPFQNSQTTQEKSIEYFTKRKTAQPLDLPNAGSVFKRQQNIVPAKLIDEAGLKGMGVGEAQISTKHAGFIVNLGNAKSKDVLTLIDIIKQKIYEKHFVNLELEIEYVSY